MPVIPVLRMPLGQGTAFPGCCAIQAENFDLIPPVLAEGPFREALEVARIAGFDALELDYYDKAKMAEQDARGALSLALREGEERGEERGEKRGLKKGLIIAIHTLASVLGIEVDAAREEALTRLSPEELESLRAALLADRRWPEGP